MPIYALDDQAPILPSSDEVWIAPNAHVVGKVRLGRDVGVWFGAVLWGDNEWLDIGERTNIQEGALLHTDPGFPLVIGSGVTMGHHAIVHGCSVGDNSLIGMTDRRCTCKGYPYFRAVFALVESGAAFQTGGDLIQGSV